MRTDPHLAPNLDRQPEVDPSPARMASLSMGLILSAGLIFGALIGGLIGHFWLDDAFGLGQDVLVGAIVGALVLAALGAGFVRALTARMSDRSR